MNEPDQSTLEMTCSGVRLHKPIHQEPNEGLVYGIGFPMQVSPTEVGMLVNIRNSGVTVVDHENGWDFIVFDSLDQIRPERAAKGLRQHNEIHPRSGRELTMVHHLAHGGFVPLGAKLPDGRPHPHQGTGFGISVVRGYPADNSIVNAHVAPDIHSYRRLVQFRYDGQKFEMTRIDDLRIDEFLPNWGITNRGYSGAICDGEDLLFGAVGGPADEVTTAGLSSAIGDGEDLLCGSVGRSTAQATVDKPEEFAEGKRGSGLSRWRFGENGWRPVEFIPVSGHDSSFEPTLLRDRDGSLLLCTRAARKDVHYHFRVYRSVDNGASWTTVIDLPKQRAASPVSILQTVKGQPFLAANPYLGVETDSKGRAIQPYNTRNRLWFWPLAPDRRSIGAPYHALDLDEVLGPPREWEASGHDNRWYADHPIGGLFRLGDEQWHSLVSFRLSDAALNIGGAPPAPEAGTWVERVLDNAPGEEKVFVPWQF